MTTPEDRDPRAVVDRSGRLRLLPVPRSQYDHIVLGHGSGGRLTAELIERLFVPALGNDVLARAGGPGDRPTGRRERRARCPGWPSRRMPSSSSRSSSRAATSAGWRSTARSTTWRSAGPSRCTSRRRSSSKKGFRWPTSGGSSRSMRAACDEAGVDAGHRRHQGRRPRQGRPGVHHHLGRRPGSGRARSVDSIGAARAIAILVSGTIGDHGVAIMSVREGIEFETVLESDSAPLIGLTRAMLAACPAVRCMRDPTRGGRVEHAQRTGGGVAAWASGSTRRRSRSGPRSAPPARCWGSTRSTSPTRGS